MRTSPLRVFGFTGTARELLVRLVDANQDRFDHLFPEVTIHSEDLAVPKEAFVGRRQQYKAEPFLEMLKNHVHHSAQALGLVDLDLFVPNLNFIFGSAEFGGNAIVALPRLRQSFYGLPDDDSLFFQRVVKEVFHELGHVMGLRHCNNHCVMRFSNSLSDTDDKPEDYCPDCLHQLGLRR